VTTKYKGRIRTLTKADIPKLKDHLFRLDPNRRNRFLGNIYDSTLERCCEHGAEAIGSASSPNFAEAVSAASCSGV
jgi:hypothetical protein